MICFPTSLHRRMSVFSSCSTESLWKHPYFYVPITSKDWLCLYLALPHLSSLCALSESSAYGEDMGFAHAAWTLPIAHTVEFFIQKEWGRTYHCVKWSAEIDTGDSITQLPLCRSTACLSSMKGIMTAGKSLHRDCLDLEWCGSTSILDQNSCFTVSRQQ